jgi:hypothetical protein
MAEQRRVRAVLEFGVGFSRASAGVCERNGVGDGSVGRAGCRAEVTAKNTEKGAERETVTDDAGQDQVLALAVGEYEVRAKKAGFQEKIRSGFHLAVGPEASVDLRLEVGAVDLVAEMGRSGAAPLPERLA